MKTLVNVFLAVNAVVWYAFQKKMLPKGLTKIISKIYFWPTFPITALMRTGNYWTAIDDTVYVMLTYCYLYHLLLFLLYRFFLAVHQWISWGTPKPFTIYMFVGQ